MLRLVTRRRRLPRLSRERRLQRRDDPDARDGRVRRDRPADDVPGPRGPQRPARGALLGRRARPAAARCSTWPRTAPRPPAAMFGKDARRPRRVRLGRHARPRRPDDRLEDNAVMLIRFADGRVATMDVSWSSKGGLESRFEAYGDGGPDRPGHHLDPAPGVHRAARRLPRREGRRRHGLGLPGPERDLRPRPRRDDGRRRRPRSARAGAPRETFEDGLIVNRILDAAYRSIQSGHWEPVGGRPWRRPRDGDDRDDARPALDDRGGRAPRARSPRPRPRRSRPPASGVRTRSPPTASSTCSAPATRGSRSRRCSRATARIRGSTRSSSCR